MLLGKLYTAYGLNEAALVSFANACVLLPRDFRWPYFLAVLYEKEGRLTNIEQHRQALEYIRRLKASKQK